METHSKYIKHTYNSAIALGWLGIVLGGLIFLGIILFVGILPIILPPAIAIVGGILLLKYGKKLKSHADNLVLAKKDLVTLIIISAITLLLTGGLLILLVLAYGIIALVSVNKQLKNSSLDAKEIVHVEEIKNTD